jgi:Fe-S-cluster containining protein
MMLMRFSANIAERNLQNRRKTYTPDMKVSTLHKKCRRCGTCCLKGGPALHPEDLSLLQDCFLRKEDLITIRKGEPLLSLSGKNVHPSPAEILKIKGSGVEWTCNFFDRLNASCRIYDRRPLECSLLQCWDTAELEKVAGKNLLNRFDLIASHDPVMPFIEAQEEQCPLSMLEELLETATQKQVQPETMTQLTNLVNIDLSIRSQAHEQFRFSLELELFYFGRPLFVILKQCGIMIREEHGTLILQAAST